VNEQTLVAGFGPYLSVSTNPSALLAEAMEWPHVVLEVSYSAVERFVFQRDAPRFERLLLLGAAPGRKFLTPELFARNTYGGAADVTGVRRSGEIEDGKPLLLTATLFDDELLASALADDPKMRLSYDAGSYLCNFVYYAALSRFPDKRVGFVHVPSFDVIPFEDQLQSLNALMMAVESAAPPAEAAQRLAIA